MSANVKHAMEKFRRKQRILKILDLVEHYKIENGETLEFIKLYRYLICEYNPTIVENVKRLNIQMKNVDDNKFMENLYKLLRDQFHYHPPLTRAQFFTSGFAEKKIEMASDVCEKLSFWNMTDVGDKRTLQLGQSSIKNSGRRRKNGPFNDDADCCENKPAKQLSQGVDTSNARCARNKMFLASKRSRDSRPSSAPLQRANSVKLHRSEVHYSPMLEILDVDASRSRNNSVRVEKASSQYSNRHNEISATLNDNISRNGSRSANSTRRVVWEKDSVSNVSTSHSNSLFNRETENSPSIKDFMQHHEIENGGRQSAPLFPRGLSEGGPLDSTVNWKAMVNSPQEVNVVLNASRDTPSGQGSKWDLERLRHEHQSHDGDNVLLMSKLDTIVKKLTHLEQRMQLCEARNGRDKEWEVGNNSLTSELNKYGQHSYVSLSKYSPQSNYGDQLFQDKYPIRTSTSNKFHSSSSKFVSEKPPLPLKFTSSILNKSSLTSPASNTSFRPYQTASFLSKVPATYLSANGESALGNSSLTSTKDTIYSSPVKDYFSSAIKNRENDAFVLESNSTSVGIARDNYGYQAKRIDSILAETQTLLSARLGLTEPSHDWKPISSSSLSGRM